MSKIALITGGSRGLGRNMALHAADAGIDIVLTYRSDANAAAAVVENIKAKGRRAVALQLDSGDVRSFGEFRETLLRVLRSVWERDRFNFLVNNAGFGAHRPFTETTEMDFDALANVHFKGVFFLTQKLLPLLVDGGRILNVSSGLTRFSTPGYVAYASMKGAVEVLTRYLAKELGPRRISVNTVAPGAIETDFGDGLVRDNAQVNTALGKQTALGRVGLPDDIGGFVAMLLADEAHWVTAQRIEISGGMFL